MLRGKKHAAEQIIPKLREAEVLMSQGSTQDEAAKQASVTTPTLVRWRQKCGAWPRVYLEAASQLIRDSA